ncbi:Ubiquitin-protein ligase E3B [Cichlidogyrus casuarinus]|uniref:HECT-type E3 ubiquitin transferase n=1 Tax=Cichlidogyrus casuarinus TaxID=1844966 RepID=A0ABD2QMU1_9PLAT
MFKQTLKTDVNGFLSEQKRKREERQVEKVQNHSALMIQSYWRGYRARSKLVTELRSEITSSLYLLEDLKAFDFIKLLKKLKFNFDDKKDHDLFVSVCKFLFESLVESTHPIGYESCMLRKDTAADWISLTKWLLGKCLNVLKFISTTTVSDTKTLNVILSLLLILTDSTKWKRVVNDPKLAPGMRKVAISFVNFLFSNGLHSVLRIVLFDGLAKATCSFNVLSLTALFTLSLRPLITREFDEQSIASYATEILTVPGFVLHINSLLPQTYEQVIEQRICSKVILLLFNSKPELEGCSVLYLVANLIQLSLLEIEVLADHCLEYCVVLSKLLNQLMTYVGGKKSNQSSWHPILGWFAQPIDKNISAALPHVTTQLKLLWHGRMVRLLFSDLYEQALLGNGSSSKEQPVQIQTLSPAIAQQPSFTRQNKTIASFKKKFGLGLFLNQVNTIGRKCGVISSSASLDSKQTSIGKGPSPKDLPEALKAVCLLYCSTFSCLREIRNDILAGLSLGDLLPRVWRLIYKCGSYKDWTQVVIRSEFSTPKSSSIPCPDSPNEVHLLFLFLAASANLLVILDDIELFELEKSFSKEELCEMGRFFNLLFYETVLLVPDPTQLAIWASGVDKIQMTVLPLCHRMLEILYERDNRFNYAPAGFWLIRDVKPSAFLADVRKSKPHAQFLLKCAPHIIAHRERIALFRDFVRADKLSLGRRLVNYFFVDESPVGATINVHRNRIVEDGYQQLANLSPHQLKLKIRVIFCNLMGLDEVGIDLDGVFKEFLEETIRRVFDPSLNLFKTTSDHRLYPSPTSYLQVTNYLPKCFFLGTLTHSSLISVKLSM